MLNRRKNFFWSLWVALGVVMVLTFMIAPPSSAAVFPGPDKFGYLAYEIDSNLRGISPKEILEGLGDDTVIGGIPLPFPFIFYGNPYNKVFISSNGFITFNDDPEDGYNGGDSIPNMLSPNNFIAGFWEDLNPSKGGVSYWVGGTDANREFVVEFKEVPHWDGDFMVTFQIILHEGSNDIELQYGSAQSDGGSHSVGIENADGTDGLQIAFGDITLEQKGFIITKSRIFKNFEVHKAIVSFGRGSELDNYDIEGEFTLPEFGDGALDPVAEDVFVSVGSSNLVIPAGFLKVKSRKQGAYFRGWVEGVLVQMSLVATGPHAYRYSIEVHRVDLTDSPIPLNFSLRVGANLGVTTIPMYGELRTGREHNYSGHKTRLKDHHSKRDYFRRYRR